MGPSLNKGIQAMIGYEAKENQGKLSFYGINIEERIRADHPIRKIAGLIDFDFIYEEVKEIYGIKGKISPS
jgi:hypothetical protein